MFVILYFIILLICSESAYTLRIYVSSRITDKVTELADALGELLVQGMTVSLRLSYSSLICLDARLSIHRPYLSPPMHKQLIIVVNEGRNCIKTSNLLRIT